MRKKSGFTLFELLVAVAIIALLATIVVPILRWDRPKEIREKFISQLNKLTGHAWRNAITTTKVQQIFFHFGNKEVLLKAEGKKDKYGKTQYVPVTMAAVKTKIKIPEQLELKNFYINREDRAGIVGKSGEVWFYITEGISQEVVINFLDKEDKIKLRKRPVGLVLNPFSAQFEVYDEFKRP